MAKYLQLAALMAVAMSLVACGDDGPDMEIHQKQYKNCDIREFTVGKLCIYSKGTVGIPYTIVDRAGNVTISGMTTQAPPENPELDDPEVACHYVKPTGYDVTETTPANSNNDPGPFLDVPVAAWERVRLTWVYHMNDPGSNDMSGSEYESE